MKTKILLTLVLLCTIFSSCDKEEKEKNSFDYPMETLYGIWDGTEIYLEKTSQWVDITKYPYTEFGFSIRFKSDKTYTGSGYFGNGSGTYEAIGKTVITYVNGKEYARYTVKSLTNNRAELTMDMGGTSTMDVRVKKK